MTWLSPLRAVAMLRRIAKAIDRSNELAEDRLRIEHPEWRRNQYRDRVAQANPKSERPVMLSTLNIKEKNEQWRETHPEE